jgi:hypothetical protein
MTIAPETNAETQARLSVRSNAEEARFVESTVLPDEERAKALLSRLAQRSSNPAGFDRAALLRLNEEAWGASED